MDGSPSLAPLYPSPPYEYRRGRVVTCLLEGAAPAMSFPPAWISLSHRRGP